MANYDNNYEINSNAGKILLGFILGAAAGAVAGILLAPEKGEVTRQNIADASTRFKSDVNSQIQKGLDKFSNLKGQALSKVGFDDDATKNGKRSTVGEEGNSGNL